MLGMKIFKLFNRSKIISFVKKIIFHYKIIANSLCFLLNLCILVFYKNLTLFIESEINCVNQVLITINFYPLLLLMIYTTIFTFLKRAIFFSGICGFETHL